MASSDVLSDTLHTITSIKLDELSKQRSNYEDGKLRILRLVNNEPDQRMKVFTLLSEIEKLSTMQKLADNPILSSANMKQFLDQAQCDPSVSQKQLKEWELKLRNELDVQSLRFEYASLYGRLVNQWLSSSDETNDSAENSTFEKVGRNEMHEQRVTWENYVFKALKMDTGATNAYLNGLFASSKLLRKALSNLREHTERFEKQLKEEVSFDEATLKWCITGLLASDLITDSKRKVLSGFVNNKVVLQELADVLNMRIKSLETWEWDADKGTPVEQRRQLNGRYRFYHDEDLLQSIFLRYIGVKWSVSMKRALTSFIDSEGVWKSSIDSIPREDKKRRATFSPLTNSSASNVEAKRADLWRETFLEQLQSSIFEGNRAYDDSDKDWEADMSQKTPQQLVQSVLHLLATDIIIKTRLGEDVTCIRSDFKWFGPSLPHSTIFTVLKFFGVSDRWLSFFKKALEAPMQFIDDGLDAPIQIRKRGTPISGPLSDFLGESVLFCLDFAVNQRTEGARLFRLHDDIWLWGSSKTCETGWAAMEEFAQTAGLEFNVEKTGCVQIKSKRKARRSSTIASKPLRLPTGEVRWGFLKLDANTGRFVIDQKQVDEHIIELRRQLDACKSVFDWIQAWNIYASRFFTVNFGSPANCSGRAHVDMMLDTFQRIQKELFSDSQHSNGNVSSAIKSMLKDKFGVEDVPEGYLYFPVGYGGLDVRSPFIGLYVIRASLTADPDKIMDDFFEREETEYRQLKTQFESRMTNSRHGGSNRNSDLNVEDIMSFEDFSKHREQTSVSLIQSFDELMKGPDAHYVSQTADVASVIDASKWNRMKSYDRWVVQLYGSEMISRFGGLNVVEKGLLPTGMVGMLRKSRFQWAG